MHTIICKAYRDNKLVGHIKVGVQTPTNLTGHIKCKLAKGKLWRAWEREGWWAFPNWDRLEIVDAN